MESRQRRNSQASKGSRGSSSGYLSNSSVGKTGQHCLKDYRGIGRRKTFNSQNELDYVVWHVGLAVICVWAKIRGKYAHVFAELVQLQDESEWRHVISHCQTWRPCASIGNPSEKIPNQIVITKISIPYLHHISILSARGNLREQTSVHWPTSLPD